MTNRRKKNPVLEVRNIEFISKQPSKFFVFTFLSLQFKFSVHACILCYLIAFPSHPIAYFLASGYLLETPNNSNFFRFPLKVQVIGSRLYLKTKNCQIYARLILPIVVYFKCHKHLNHKTYNIFHSRTSYRV